MRSIKSESFSHVRAAGRRVREGQRRAPPAQPVLLEPQRPDRRRSHGHRIERGEEVRGEPRLSVEDLGGEGEAKGRTFVTLDGRLRDAATREGFIVLPST